MKKAPGKTQTLRAGCSKAEPKIFAPLQAQDSQNLISWRWSLPAPTDPVWWRSMYAISSYRGNRPTKPQTHNAGPPARPPARPLQTGPITIHYAAKLSTLCNKRLCGQVASFVSVSIIMITQNVVNIVTLRSLTCVQKLTLYSSEIVCINSYWDKETLSSWPAIGLGLWKF